MKKAAIAFALFTLVSVASAQTFLLDDFNSDAAPGQGAVNASTSWIGQVTQNPTTITVGGTAKDENGWEYFPTNFLNLSSFDQITVVGQRDVGNVASNFAISFDSFDGENFSTQVVSILMTEFAVGSLTTVTIPIVWTIDAANIAYVSLGGGSIGASAFRMTLDDLSLSTAAAIPEPSTYAAIVGALALGFVAYRRRVARVA